MDAADVGDLHLAAVVINTSDMRRGVDFWSAALGYVPRDSPWDPDFMLLQPPDGRGLPVSLQRTEPDHLQPVRVHLDLYTSEQERHVRRLVALGATEVPEWTYPDDPDFVVLRDPDGNEFCVIDQPGLA